MYAIESIQKKFLVSHHNLTFSKPLAPINDYTYSLKLILKDFQPQNRNNDKMINFAYFFFFYLLIAEIVMFLLLILPASPGFKSKLVRAMTGTRFRRTLLCFHLGLSGAAGLFLLDLRQTEQIYRRERSSLSLLGNGHFGSELKLAVLSYQIQMVQRNKYITFMVIYVSVALNIYIRMLHFIYQKRGDYDYIAKHKQHKDKSQWPKNQPNLQEKTHKRSQKREENQLTGEN